MLDECLDEIETLFKYHIGLKRYHATTTFQNSLLQLSLRLLDSDRDPYYIEKKTEEIFNNIFQFELKEETSLGTLESFFVHTTLEPTITYIGNQLRMKEKEIVYQKTLPYVRGFIGSIRGI